ncbi:MAG: hypothetical protein GY913_12305 [Proteobacteria bacterium]|nr:hypothetical protein [Pseudomonadota bacterium]MCP4917698.1 hypothetical protein [Pseudomonadota bacterium]
MLRILHRKTELARAQAQLEELFRGRSDGPRQLDLGIGPRRDVCYVEAWDLWCGFARDDRHYLNLFGLGYPFGRRLDEVVEINSPTARLDRRMGGAFARSEDRELYLVHRGIVAGGKRAMFDWHRGHLVPVQDGKKVSKVIIVANLDGDSPVAEVGGFVRGVAAFKAGEKSPRPRLRTALEEAFHRHHPDAVFEIVTTDLAAAFGRLVLAGGAVLVAPDGVDIDRVEELGYEVVRYRFEDGEARFG